MSITLVELLKMHRDIMNALDTTIEGQNDFRFAALGVVVEIAEALQELPWRPWRKTDHRAPGWDELDKAVPELADAMGALLRCVVNLGIEPEHFAQACEAHIVEKWRRIREGIDR